MATAQIALIGAGRIGKIHSLALQQLEARTGTDVHLAVLVDPYAEDLADRATAWGWTATSRDPFEVIGREDIDTIIIATPNSSHHELAMAAIQAGKTVVCEKPLAGTLEQADEMTRAAEQLDVRTATGFVFRAWPVVQHAARLIQAGKIGEPFGFTGTMRHGYGLKSSRSLGWRGDNPQLGTGALVDIGSHITDIARTMMGDIESVSANLINVVPTRFDQHGVSYPSPIDDAAFLALRFVGGGSGHVNASWAAAGYGTELSFEVLGAKGSLAFSWRSNAELTLGTPDGHRSVWQLDQSEARDPQFGEVAGLGVGYVGAFAAFYRQHLSPTESVPTFRDGLHNMAVLSAARDSAAAGGHHVPVALPHVDVSQAARTRREAGPASR